MAQSYFSLVTTAGKIKLAQSAAGGNAVVITHFAVGDGNGAETSPTAASSALVREVWRTPVESVETDPDNPAAVLVTAIIPTNAGGWWMREFGIFADDGTMIAVAKPVSQYKPTALEGQLEDIRYEFQIIIGENANVTLLVDPSLIFATREWVIARRIPMAQMMRLPWLPVISMTLSSAPGTPALGDTYLIPANATGIWAENIGKLAEWAGSAWSYVMPPNGHGISLPDGRAFERIDGVYVEKLARDAQSGKWNFAVAGGTANALTATLNPVPAALPVGMVVMLQITATNTGPATLNVNGLGAVAIVSATGGPIVAGDLKGICEFIYTGANFQMVSASPQSAAVRALAAGEYAIAAGGIPNTIVTGTMLGSQLVESFDNANALAAGIFTVPFDGVLIASISTDTVLEASASAASLGLFRNGTYVDGMMDNAAWSVNRTMRITYSKILKVAKGDVVQFSIAWRNAAGTGSGPAMTGNVTFMVI